MCPESSKQVSATHLVLLTKMNKDLCWPEGEGHIPGDRIKGKQKEMKSMVDNTSCTQQVRSREALGCQEGGSTAPLVVALVWMVMERKMHAMSPLPVWVSGVFLQNQCPF
jgi:hypothetical protein